jgi:glutamate synthase (NADPH/NADH) small chain
MRRYKTILKAYPKKRDAIERIEDFQPIYYNYEDSEAKAQASRCLQCPIDLLRGLQSEFKFCRTGCPLNNNIPRWLKKTYENDMIAASELSNARSPFPEILGRVCPKKGLCESSCTLEKTPHHAVSIGNIEVYFNERAYEQGFFPFFGDKANRRFKVAVVGSGPASLSCATFLLRANIDVEIFEKESYVGGLLTYGIPNFKLPKHVILRRLEWMKEAGLKVHYDVEVGRDISIQELQKHFDAIFLGLGAPQGRSADMQNEDAIGVHQVMDILSQTQKSLFLHEFHQSIFKDKDVVVIGGGDSAMDALRTAIRHKAKHVTCIYRRDEESMPGSRAEVINAKEEGVQFRFFSQPKKALVDEQNRVIGLEIMRTFMDENGRIQNDESQTCVIQADSIILALGFQAKRFGFYDELGLEVGKSNTILVDENKETSHPMVFAGGDVVRGANLVVNAALDGREAAFAIAKKLGAAIDPKFNL